MFVPKFGTNRLSVEAYGKEYLYNFNFFDNYAYPNVYDEFAIIDYEKYPRNWMYEKKRKKTWKRGTVNVVLHNSSRYSGSYCYRSVPCESGITR